MVAAGADTTAIAATQEAAEHAAVDCPPDFITSDVRLAQGTGPAAVAWIRERVGDIPVVFITATPDECYPCGFGVVVAKPFDADAIAQAFRIATQAS